MTSAVLTREPEVVEAPQRAVPARQAPARFRLDIQALRALAVSLVVVYHLWPTTVSGGFVGVDAFFAISGFLITSHLVREVDQNGRVRLLSFWARRMRRLLPAALLVLLVVAALVWLFVPEGLWQQYFGEIGGSSVYVQNWVLVSDAVNYFSAQNGASPVQNFWSLSAEEQFYLVWPLLIVLPLLLPLRPRTKRIVTVSLLAAGTIASFVYGIHETRADASVSYLATTARAWEFGLGGLLAFAVTLPRPKWLARTPAGPTFRTLLAWAGLTAILVSAFAYTGSTPFPGTAALLPVCGVLAVIAAGMPDTRWAPNRLLAVRPVQKLGDLSYSLYLWHWPLIVLVPFVVAKYVPSFTALDNVEKFGILAASLGIAWLSKKFVEDPARFAAFLAKHKPRRTFPVMAGAMALVVAVSGLGWNVVELDNETSAATEASLLAQSPACFGAAALDSSTPNCSDAALDNVLVPTPVAAASEIPKSCMIQTASEGTPTICYAGVSASKAVKTVALVGDSHAAQWLPALETIAKQNNWRIVEFLKGSCAFNDANRAAKASFSKACTSWNTAVQADLAKMPGVSAVFTSADVEDLYMPSAASTRIQNGVAGFESSWSRLPSTVQNVYVLRDTPRPSSTAQDCLELLSTSQRLQSGACSVSKTTATSITDPAAVAAAAVGGRVSLIDLTNSFCTATECDPVVGHVTVYRDTSHITTTYSQTLAPYLFAAIQNS